MGTANNSLPGVYPLLANSLNRISHDVDKATFRVNYRFASHSSDAIGLLFQQLASFSDFSSFRDSGIDLDQGRNALPWKLASC
jgi:hypothetical protein